MKKLLRRQNWPEIALLATVAATVALLHRRGQPWWCVCEQWWPWTLEPYSSHTSQHLIDPYSLTHLQHGLVLCWLVGWAVPKWKWPWRVWLAVVIEAGWELLENSQLIIERYRTATAALGYNGDSVVNTLGDILCCYARPASRQKIGMAQHLATVRRYRTHATDHNSRQLALEHLDAQRRLTSPQSLATWLTVSPKSRGDTTPT